MLDDEARPNQVFADIPPGPAGHARLHMYAVISRILAHLGLHDTPRLAGLELRLPGLGRRRDEDDEAHEPDALTIAARFPFLAGYRAAFARYVPESLDPLQEAAWWEA